MGLGERIAARRQRNRRVVLVPEWGDDATLSIYVSVLTCHEVDRIQKKHKDFLSGSMSMEAMVDLIILKSENADGDKLFTLEDKPHLMREPVAVVSRVAAEMMNSALTVEDAEKN